MIRLFILLIFLHLSCFSKIELSDNEKEFFKTHPIVTLGIDKGFVPYILENKNGTILRDNISLENDNKILLDISNKLISDIGEKQKQEIINKWVTLKYEEKVDNQLIIQIILFASFIVIMFIYWNRKIHKARNKLELSNKENEKYFKMINSHILISSSNTSGVITDVSDALCNLTGYTKDELVGKSHSIFRHKDTKASVFSDMWNTIKKEKIWKGELKNLKKDGTFYWADVIITPIYNNDSKLVGYNAIRHDITDKKRIEQVSIIDKLTGIYNRNKLDDVLNNELKRTKRNKGLFGVILLDIDNFKKVNDNYGHLSGDKILITIANILKNNLREIDVFGRWGGEEFLIICPHTSEEGLVTLAETLRKKIETYKFKDYDSQSASFGLAVCRKNDTSNSIILRADNALYKAKNNGRNKTEI